VGLRLWQWLRISCPWVLRVCSGPVWLWTTVRRSIYRLGWISTRKLPQPVISVGNVTVGGTGKTPFVIWLAHRLHESGRKVAILSRGYGRSLPSEYLIVSDGQQVQTTWQLSGDEPFLIAQKCPWAVVAVGANRYELGRWVNTRFDCDCFILDDGFQHLQLHRDLNFVLLDARDETGIEGVLPAGFLREPLRSLRDATGIVLTKVAAIPAAQPIIRKLEHTMGSTVAPIYVKFALPSCWHLGSGAQQTFGAFGNQKALAFSGIGNAQGFLEGLEAVGIDVVEDIRFQDHFPFSAHEMESIRQVMKEKEIPVALTTEKDAVKIKEWVRPGDAIWVATLEVEVIQGSDSIMNLLKDLPWKTKDGAQAH